MSIVMLASLQENGEVATIDYNDCLKVWCNVFVYY